MYILTFIFKKVSYIIICSDVKRTVLPAPFTNMFLKSILEHWLYLMLSLPRKGLGWDYRLPYCIGTKCCLCTELICSLGFYGQQLLVEGSCHNVC